jgi:hypothetical protein
MDEIEGDLDHFAVNPKLYSPLRSFCCGRAETRPEKEVNRMVREYSRGKRQCTIFRVTVERPNRLVGVAALHPAMFGPPILQQFNGFPYVSVIGVSEHFRGKGKDGVRLGDHVLRDGLREINRAWRGAPDVFAFIDPNNEHSRELFIGRNDFEVVIHANPNNPEDDSLIGRRGKPVP